MGAVVGGRRNATCWRRCNYPSRNEVVSTDSTPRMTMVTFNSHGAAKSDENIAMDVPSGERHLKLYREIRLW